MIFGANAGGFVGYVGGFLNGAVGVYGYMVFIALFVLCLMKLISRKKTVKALPCVWFFIAITAFSLFMHVIFSSQPGGTYAMEGKTFEEYVSACYGGQDFVSFGGVVCGSLVKLLYDLAGSIGCYGVFIGLLLVSLFLFLSSVSGGKFIVATEEASSEKKKDKKDKDDDKTVLKEDKKEKQPERVNGDEIASRMKAESDEEEEKRKVGNFLSGFRKNGDKRETPASEKNLDFRGSERTSRERSDFNSGGETSSRGDAVGTKRDFVRGEDGEDAKKDASRFPQRSGQARTEGDLRAQAEAREVLYGDIPEDKRRSNFIPKDTYTRSFEEEKINYFSAKNIPTAPKEEFVDTSGVMPPKILHETQGVRRIDAIENAYRQKNSPVATDSSMRRATTAPKTKNSKQRAEEPLHKDLLCYKMDMQEDPNLPPIINADEWNANHEKQAETSDTASSLSGRTTSFGRQNENRESDFVDNRPPIINADAVIAERNRIQEMKSDERTLYREDSSCGVNSGADSSVSFVNGRYSAGNDANNGNTVTNSGNSSVNDENSFANNDGYVESIARPSGRGSVNCGDYRTNVDYSQTPDNGAEFNVQGESDLSHETKNMIISSMEDFRKLKNDMSSPDAEDEYVDDRSEYEEVRQTPDIQSGRNFGAELHEYDGKKILDNAKKEGNNVMITEDYSSKIGNDGVQMRINDLSEIFEERTTPFVPYKAPPLGLLQRSLSEGIDDELRKYLDDTGNLLVQVLSQYNVQASVRNIVCGPSVALYEMELASGMTIRRVTSINDDLARNISAEGSVRIISHIPGKNCCGIEVPLPVKNRKTVYLRDILESKECKNSTGVLNIALGMSIEGKSVFPDLMKMPHLLIGGSTGSGKSVLLNSVIISLLYRYSPEQIRFILVDPKRVEFMAYNGMPHMLIPSPVNDVEKAINAFGWLCDEMDRRYRLFEQAKVKNLDSYNALIDKEKYIPMPRIVLVVDELCDLMTTHKSELEGRIKRLSQLARAAGIHLILATQRPSVDVITGVIKSNLPSRIALKVTNYPDSKTIIDQGGAERLCQKGEMLFMSEAPLQRIQGPFVADEEIASVINYIAKNNVAVFDEEAGDIINTEKAENNKADEDDFLNNRDKDPLFAKALKTVVSNGAASISLIQRTFSIGFNRANRIYGAMVIKGYVVKSDANKPGQVLLTKEQFNELYGEECGYIT